MSKLPDATRHERALEALKAKGNPFRQQFARNSDDRVCSLYHVDGLFAKERRLLEELVESYRSRPDRPTSELTLLGARGAGKTHLLHWLKHSPGVAPQLFVTPGTFRIDSGGLDSSFLEYLLYQLINVLLADGEQRGARPLIYVAEHVSRQTLAAFFGCRDAATRLELLSANRLRQIGFRFGLGNASALAAIDGFIDRLANTTSPCRQLVEEVGLDARRVTADIVQWLAEHRRRDLKGEFARRITAGLIQISLLDDERELADFLTDGFADVPLRVKPTRAQLTLSLLEALTERIVGSGIPIAVAFDQLEELLYGQTEAEIRRSSDAFFGGVVQLMSLVPGLCLLLFVEEGLWNRIVPPLPSHILDRLHEPIHLPDHGTTRDVRLSAPSVSQLVDVVSCRVRTTLSDFEGVNDLPPEFPFGREFLTELARSESVLRLMLQGCCNRLDMLFADPGPVAHAAGPAGSPIVHQPAAEQGDELGVEDRWHAEVRSSSRKLQSVGSLAAAVVELQGSLARWLALCKRLGVEQESWRLTGITDQVSIGSHPTYGIVTIAEWTNRSAAVARVAIGLWLGRGVGKPRDLATKLAVFEAQPPFADHLILLRPADDTRLSGKTELAWNRAIEAGHSVRLRPVELEIFAKLHAFPRWMQQITDLYPAGQVPEAVYHFLARETEPILRKLVLPASKVARQAG